jgi:hypothetical protein
VGPPLVLDPVELTGVLEVEQGPVDEGQVVVSTITIT